MLLSLSVLLNEGSFVFESHRSLWEGILEFECGPIYFDGLLLLRNSQGRKSDRKYDNCTS